MPVKISSVIMLFFLIVNSSAAQQVQVSRDSIRKDALNVYMEASDYIRKEIPYINYVRDLKEADVYIISTYQTAGSGGMQYTYFITGQNRFSGMADTVSFTSSPDNTQDYIREQQVRVLKLGLMRYVAKTPLSQYLNVTFTLPVRESLTTDKWNNWVFRSSVSGYLNGEKSYNYTNLYGNISASKITEDWKINISARYSYGIDNFIINGTTYTSKNNSTGFSSLIVKSISDHWSYGGSVSASSSSYSNLKLSLSLLPGIEYDIYPYSQSTRKQLRLLYRAGFNSVFYNDTTIYNKTKENLLMHSLTASYAVVQKWGSIDISLGYSNYLHDWSKNNLSLNGDLSLRIAKGLNLELGGGVTLIHDQLSLVKGGATAEEVLLRRKQLETQYSVFAMFGFSYTFGSIYNNVVNPRFGSSGSTRYIIMN